MTTASSAASHSTVTMMRSPGRPYAVHVSTCVQARNTAPSSAGQTRGSSSPHDQRTKGAVSSHRLATASVPKSMGQPASARVVTGSVNMRAGKGDWRAARSPPRPKLNTARKYMNAVERGTISAAAMPFGGSSLSGLSGPGEEEPDGHEDERVAGECDERGPMSLAKLPGDGERRRAHASRVRG